MTSRILALCMLSGCVSSTERTLREWEGVYKFTNATANEEGCDAEGPQLDLNHRFFELDTVEGFDDHLAELRPCTNTEDCDAPGFVTWYAPKVTASRMDGSFSETFYTVAGEQGGLCQAVYDIVEARRDGDVVRIAVESAIATDLVAASSEVCLDLLTSMAEDEDRCDSLQVFEGRRAD